MGHVASERVLGVRQVGGGALRGKAKALRLQLFHWGQRAFRLVGVTRVWTCDLFVPKGRNGFSDLGKRARFRASCPCLSVAVGAGGHAADAQLDAQGGMPPFAS